MRLRSAICAALFLVGCFQTSATVPFEGPDASADSGSAVDTGGDPPDEGNPAEEMGPEDVGVEYDLAGTALCAAPPDNPPRSVCDPTTQRGCDVGRTCDVILRSPDGDPEFSVACRGFRLGEVMGARDGESCDEETPCRPALRCLGGQCRRYCDLTVENECGAEFCNPIFPAEQVPQWGVCLPECADRG